MNKIKEKPKCAKGVHCDRFVFDSIPMVEQFFLFFRLFDTQMRDGVYALDWNVILKACELNDIKVDNRFLELLKVFECGLMEVYRDGK